MEEGAHIGPYLLVILIIEMRIRLSVFFVPKGFTDVCLDFCHQVKYYWCHRVDCICFMHLLYLCHQQAMLTCRAALKHIQNKSNFNLFVQIKIVTAKNTDRSFCIETHMFLTDPV